MRRAFIDLQATSNNLKTALVLTCSVALIDGEEEVYYMQSHILHEQDDDDFKTSMHSDTAQSFVDMASDIIANLQECEVGYFDKFSEQLWRKSFLEIGYPIGRSSLIFKDLVLKNKSRSEQLSFEEIAAATATTFNAMTPGMNARGLAQLFYNLYDHGDVESHAFAKAKNNTISKVNLYDHLPKTCGVYYFRNDRGEVIYVGKAIDIKKRVISHFKSKAKFERILCEETQSVEFYETGNELIALLKESSEIKNLAPIYNSQQIEVNNPWVIESKVDAKGILRLVPTEKNYSDSCHTVSFNRDSAVQQLKLLQIMHHLCPRFIGVERTSGPCSSKMCKGICQGKELKTTYNDRVLTALSKLKNKEETYYLNLQGRSTAECSFVLVIDGIYMGYGYITNQETINSIEDLEAYLLPQEHTYYTSRSILSHLSKRGVVKNDLK